MLGPSDLRTVLTELLPACADWYNIGLALNMSLGTLDGMEGPYKRPRDCLREMLREWLRTSPPDPTWEGLIAALKDPIVGHGTLARQLETKYCTQEPPPGKPEHSHRKVVSHWYPIPPVEVPLLNVFYSQYICVCLFCSRYSASWSGAKRSNHTAGRTTSR